MHGDLDHILIDRERIGRRVAELGREIAQAFGPLGPDEPIVLVPVMTGSIIFTADLMRHLPRKVRIGIVTASSYPGARTTTTGDPLLGALPQDLDGRHVLVVDDILDSGTTLARVREAVTARGAASVRACVLLRKPSRLTVPVDCEFVGFDIPDAFVVGYGLDYDGLYRNLPDIGVLKAGLVGDRA